MLAVLYQIAQNVPEEVQQTARDIAQRFRDDPAFMWTLVAVGVITAVLFIWLLVKQAFKAAIVGALLCAGAWYWFFAGS
jgi:hypothetical protein